jgi:hypothetical protein
LRIFNTFKLQVKSSSSQITLPDLSVSTGLVQLKYAIIVGIYNGLKPNQYTITANERFDLAGGYYGMLRYILGLEPGGK